MIDSQGSVTVNNLISWIDDVNTLHQRSLDAFKNIFCFYWELPDELKPSVEAISGLVNRILNNEFTEAMALIEANKESWMKDALISEKITVFQQTADDIKKDLLLGITCQNFTRTEWRKIYLLNTHLAACTCSESTGYGPRLRLASQIVIFSKNIGIKDEANIASLGAGHCLQELATHTEFVKKGYKVNWIVIDPEFKKSNSSEYKAAMEFKKLIGFLSPQSKVEIYGEGVTEYTKRIKSGQESSIPNILLAIDLGSEIGEYFLPDTKRVLKEIIDPKNPRILVETYPGKHVDVSSY